MRICIIWGELNVSWSEIIYCDPLHSFFKFSCCSMLTVKNNQLPSHLVSFSFRLWILCNVYLIVWSLLKYSSLLYVYLWVHTFFHLWKSLIILWPSVTPKVFHLKLKCHLFKNSYPDSSDPLSSHSLPKLHPPKSYSASSGNRTLTSHGLRLFTTPLIWCSARE